MGRNLIFIGLAITVIGIIVSFGSKIPYVGRLPGDIIIKREHFSFYFPLTTCILVSFIFMLLSRFFGPK